MKYINKIFYLLVIFGFEGYAQTCDLQFVVLNIGANYDIKIQIRGNSSFKLGTSNITFDYNKEDLSNPTILTAYNFNGGLYDSLTIGTPSSGVVSVNIVFNGGFENGMMVDTVWTNLVSIRFNIDDLSGNSGLSFRNITPNKTGVFKDDNFTFVEEGNWMRENTTPLPVELSPLIVNKFELFQNYPNPFNPSTIIKFELPEATSITLTIYNILGEKVLALADGFLEAGFHSYNFDAKSMASGTYIYRLQSDKFIETKKMLFLK